MSTCEAMREVGVQRKTAQRYLKEFSELDLTHKVGVGSQEKWVVEPAFQMLKPNPMHAVALELGRELAQFMEGSGLQAGLESIAPTSFEELPHRWRRNFDRKFRLQHEPHRDYTDQSEVVLDVMDGLLRERSLRLEYERGDGTRRVHEALWPLTLVVYRRALYLLVTREDGRTFDLAVDRILSADVGEPFDYPADWRPEKVLASRFGMVTDGEPERVVLRFAPEVARWVEERIWHPSQELTRLEDGRVELVMMVAGKELRRLVLEWGEHCEVVAPAKLREEVAQAVRRMGEMYGGASAEMPPSPDRSFDESTD